MGDDTTLCDYVSAVLKGMAIGQWAVMHHLPSSSCLTGQLITDVGQHGSLLEICLPLFGLIGIG